MIDLRIWASAWKPPQMVTPEDIQLFTQKNLQDVLNMINDKKSLFKFMRWTGKTDIEGKKIFENDIIGIFVFSETEDKPKLIEKYEVVYSKKLCAFVVVEIRGLRSISIPVGHINCGRVIGNVYQNPELLTSKI